MSNNNRGGSDISWVLIIAAFLLFWPVGVVLLIAKLSEEGKSGRQDWQAMRDDVRQEMRNVKRELGKEISDIEQQRRRYAEPGHSHYYEKVPKATTPKTSTYNAHPYTQHSAQERMGKDAQGQEAEASAPKPRYGANAAQKKGKKPKIKSGKALMIAGAIIAVLFGFTGASEVLQWLPSYPIYALREVLPYVLLSGGGAAMAAWGAVRNKKARQFRKLLNMIGNSKQIDIQALAEAVPCSYNRACDSLQDMIDEGLLGEHAYLDYGTGQLMMDGKGLGERKGRKKKDKAAEDNQAAQSEEMRILSEIRRVNEDIPDEELSRKIDRIEEITRHIFDYQKKHPDKAGELHKFLNYYLPTTLKILNSYAELDKQGVDGSNITTTKERIAGMMDSIVEGFENQLDKLFEGDMLDISSDISVMERMLSRDGLSGGLKMPKPGETPQLTLDPEGTAAAPESESADEWTAPVVTPTSAQESAPADEWTAPVVTPDPVPESAEAWTEPAPLPESAPAPGWTAPVTSPFTTPEGISLTLTPDADQAAQAAQSAPGWEDGFYRRTREELDQQ